MFFIFTILLTSSYKFSLAVYTPIYLVTGTIIHFQNALIIDKVASCGQEEDRKDVDDVLPQVLGMRIMYVLASLLIGYA